jgi:ankyrin repeat protein
LERGAGINLQNNDGNTPLQIAVDGDKLDLVYYFVEKGADINLQNNPSKRGPLQEREIGGPGGFVVAFRYDRYVPVHYSIHTFTPHDIKDRDR